MWRDGEIGARGQVLVRGVVSPAESTSAHIALAALRLQDDDPVGAADVAVAGLSALRSRKACFTPNFSLVLRLSGCLEMPMSTRHANFTGHYAHRQICV